MHQVFKDSLSMILAHEDEREFMGRVAYVPLSENLKAKIFFATTTTHEVYDSVKIELINKKEGIVDTLVLRLGEICGLINIGGQKQNPHIWRYGSNEPFEWYGKRPDLSPIRKEVDKYFEFWRN